MATKKTVEVKKAKAEPEKKPEEKSKKPEKNSKPKEKEKSEKAESSEKPKAKRTAKDNKKENKKEEKKPAKDNKKKSEPMNKEQKRITSVVLFLVGILLVFVSIIESSGLWLILHNVIHGLFGAVGYLIGAVIIYIAFLLENTEDRKVFAKKLLQTVCIIFAACGFIQIFFVGKVEGNSFFECIKNLYSDGCKLKGGGVFAGVFGWTALAGLGKVGARIVVIVLLAAFIMLFANISVTKLAKAVSVPFIKIPQNFKTFKETLKERYKFKRDIKFGEADTTISFFEPVEKDNKETISEDSSSAEPEVEIEFSSVGRGMDKPNTFAPIDKPEKIEDIISHAITEHKQEKPVGRHAKKSSGKYKFPPVELLDEHNNQFDIKDAQREAKEKADTLIDALDSFGVKARITGICRGPSVTRYELQPALGVKVAKITGLENDIALNLASEIRIQAPIPGKSAIGVEVANKCRESVSIKELICSKEYQSSKSKLSFAVGKNIEGKIVMGDISHMPHMLIAGTTGSGKSVFTNSIIMNILFHASPDDVKLILIDPKRVEFPVYNGIPHLLIPVVTEPLRAAGALSWAVGEMQNRYKQLAANGVRGIDEYNELAEENPNLEKMTKIVIVVDELADLMMAAPKDVEDYIQRLAQLARAAGIHMIIATQSPRKQVITGIIKANIPSTVALSVSNFIDSNLIIGQGGAEKLLGHGDMLYNPIGTRTPIRIQGSFVSTEEVKKVVDFLKSDGECQYSEEIISEVEKNIPTPKGEQSSENDSKVRSTDSDEEVIEKALRLIIDMPETSVTMLQRKLGLGFGRAARIMDTLEDMGFVGESNGSKGRKVLITKQQYLERQARN